MDGQRMVFLRSQVKDVVSPIAWRILGPFDAAAGQGNAAASEAERDLIQGVIGASYAPSSSGQVLSWRNMTAASISGHRGFVNFLDLYPVNTDGKAAYAQTYIRSEEARDVQLLLGSDDGIQVWLNGQEVFRTNVLRVAAPRENVVGATLNKGWNTALVRVDNGDGGWSFYWDVADTNGNAIPTLEYARLDPVSPQTGLAPAQNLFPAWRLDAGWDRFGIHDQIEKAAEGGGRYLCGVTIKDSPESATGRALFSCREESPVPDDRHLKVTLDREARYRDAACSIKADCSRAQLAPQPLRLVLQGNQVVMKPNRRYRLTVVAKADRPELPVVFSLIGGYRKTADGTPGSMYVGADGKDPDQTSSPPACDSSAAVNKSNVKPPSPWDATRISDSIGVDLACGRGTCLIRIFPVRANVFSMTNRLPSSASLSRGCKSQCDTCTSSLHRSEPSYSETCVKRRC